MTIYEKLSKIQVELKAPKSQRNNFGNYNYRNCEDILEALKPLLKEHKASVVLSDDIVQFTGGEEEVTLQSKDKAGNINATVINGNVRFYIKATAKIICNESGESQEAFGYARETLNKKGMDEAQVTGAASSYARKYALNGLFAIDDTKDADSHDNRTQASTAAPAKQDITPKKTTSTAPASDKQKGMIFAIAKNLGRSKEDMDKYTQTAYGCNVNDLNKTQASGVIEFLQDKQKEGVKKEETITLEDIDAAMNPSRDPAYEDQGFELNE